MKKKILFAVFFAAALSVYIRREKINVLLKTPTVKTFLEEIKK